MKQITIAFLCMFLCVGFNTQAQTKKNKLVFYSINQMGLLNGNLQTAFSMQSINGVQYKTWFSGIGIGLDVYQKTTIPVFLDIRKHFGHNKLQPLLYADGGISIPTRDVNYPAKYDNGNNAYTLYISPYYEAGIGFQSDISDKARFVCTLGYSYKRFSYLQQYQYNIVSSIPINYDNRYDYYFNRIAVKMGLIF